MERLEQKEQSEQMEYTEQPGRIAPPRLVEDSVWLASRLLRRQVVDVSAIEPVGRVIDLVFDPISSQVMGLVIQPNNHQRGLRATFNRLLKRPPLHAIVGLDHVISMDGDVIMINADPFHLTTSRELQRMPHLNVICEMTILTGRGTCLGTLADLLLEEKGATIHGYVVIPTASGEQMLPTLDETLPHVEAPSNTSLPRMRIMPASSNVRIGESLILMLADAEPLREEVVIVSQEVGERAKLKGA